MDILALTNKQIIEIIIAKKNNELNNYLTNNNLNHLISIKGLDKELEERFNLLKNTPVRSEGELNEEVDFLNPLFNKRKKTKKESVKAVLTNLKKNV